MLLVWALQIISLFHRRGRDDRPQDGTRTSFCQAKWGQRQRKPFTRSSQSTAWKAYMGSCSPSLISPAPLISKLCIFSQVRTLGHGTCRNHRPYWLVSKQGNVWTATPMKLWSEARLLELMTKRELYQGYVSSGGEEATGLKQLRTWFWL